ncbi:MAG: ParB/RepB/Spo0J family partition protein [Thermodesulfobacteriota bacterium]
MKDVIFARVAADRISRQPPFLLSWGRDPAGLKESLERVGQISPLLLWPSQDRLEIVCGVRRYKIGREIGLTEYKALLLPDNVTEVEALLLALEDNLGQRDFNDAEKVLAVNHLGRHFQVEEITSRFLPRLGLPPKPEFLRRYLGLSGLGEAGLDALAQGRLDPETGEFLLELRLPDWMEFLNLNDRLGFNRNQRRQALSWLEEIGRREEMSFHQILASEDIISLLDAEKPGRADKEKMVRAALRARRYPRLARLEADRAERIKVLDLPAGLRLDLPRNFEGLNFTLGIDFSDEAALSRGIEAATRLTADRRLKDLLELG